MTGIIVEFLLLLVAHAAVGIYSSPLRFSKKITYIIWGAWILLQCALLFVSEFVVTDLAFQFFVGFAMSLLGQYLLFFATTRGSLLQRIFTMLTYSIFFCIAMALFTLVKGTFTQMHEMFVLLIQAAMLFIIVTYFLRSVCPLCRAAARNITTGWAPLIFVNAVFLITVILSSVFPVRLTSFGDPAFVTFVFLSVSIMAVYPVIFSSINNMSEAATKREVEAQNKLLLMQIEAENAQITADSQARHDRRHHNLVLLEFAKNNDVENVKKYLENLVESESKIWGEVRYCENTTANTVMTVYERRAKENGISVNVSAHVSRDVDVLPKDLVIVIANLFENAIHAASRLKIKDKHIDISIREDANRLIIKVENTCKEKMLFDESQYGIGIQSVITTTGKYDGMYDFTAEDGIFSAKVSLNLK